MSSEKRKIAYIDGKPYEIGANHTSILKFVKSYVGEKKVPTLCDDPNLAPYGACRVCSVEVALEKDGPTRMVASCHTPVAENQHIFTSNEAITSLRKNIVELVLTDHPMECDSCEVNNNCELQTVANDLGISDHRYNSPKQHKGIPRDTSHDYMRMNLDNCINCGRCVRACDEIQGPFVLTMSGRGFESKITTDNDMMFGDSDSPQSSITRELQSRRGGAELASAVLERGVDQRPQRPRRPGSYSGYGDTGYTPMPQWGNAPLVSDLDDIPF